MVHIFMSLKHLRLNQAVVWVWRVYIPLHLVMLVGSSSVILIASFSRRVMITCNGSPQSHILSIGLVRTRLGEHIVFDQKS